MNEQDFLSKFLFPSESKLDKNFTISLPAIQGLREKGLYIIQCELDGTASTNIVTKYSSDVLGIRLTEVYKNTQHKRTGVFVRLVGSMSIVRTGYPFVFIDAAVSNVSPLTGQRENLTTRVVVSLPQSDTQQRKHFYNTLNETPKETDAIYRFGERDTLPDFWGPVWAVQEGKFDVDLIRQLRECVFSAYIKTIEMTVKRTEFDYRPLQEHVIFNTARRENGLFTNMGLSVPVEAQSAFFSLLSSSE